MFLGNATAFIRGRLYLEKYMSTEGQTSVELVRWNVVEFLPQYRCDATQAAMLVVQRCVGDELMISVDTGKPSTSYSKTVPSSHVRRIVISEQERTRMFAMIYAQECKDYKLVMQDGQKSVMAWAKYGPGLHVEASMSDAELIERYRDALQRKARKARRHGNSYIEE